MLKTKGDAAESDPLVHNIQAEDFFCSLAGKYLALKPCQVHHYLVQTII